MTLKKILACLLSFSILLSASTFANNTPFYLTGYWQNFTNPAETPVRLIDIPAGYNVITIAFADMASDGSVTFNLQGPPYTSMPDGEAVFKNDIKTLQNRGVKVLLSLGGQNGYYVVNNEDQKKKFIASLEKVITEYGFDGLDYDIESGLTTANVTYLVEATKTIKQDVSGKSLMFTLAPETIDLYWQVFPHGKYDALIQSGLINIVHAQLYNSGCMPGSKPGSACYAQGTEDFIVSQADSTIQTWLKNGITNAVSLYAIGLPAAPSAAGGGYVDAITLNKALTCLKTQKACGSYVPTQAYPEFNHVMTWSINWDAKNGYAFEKGITGNH